ncbi:chromatin assembly factor 1 subunit A [Oncorhynchus kisutch]|uniref:chromatin assembly factor 1 subunit A n=1 Tax=Oncorhynchus kisutch TaxID=8019 RepID=UPI00099F8C03|nr:chromatin assembly factor 1 subunit A [Oncorhynchus kisutch]
MVLCYCNAFPHKDIKSEGSSRMVMLAAAEDPSVDGHLASTPRRGGMDGKVKSSNANKKLVQARLPFKRLNPEPKEISEPKRTCTLSRPGLSDGENESDCSPLPVRHGPALVNGRGPLDGFMSRSTQASPAKSIVIDLTEDSNSTDLLKQQPATPIVASCPPTQNSHLSKTLSALTATKTDHTAKTEPIDYKLGDEQKDGEEEKDRGDTASISQLDTTQGSDTEEEEEEDEEQEEADMSSHGNESMLSPSSTSSLSAAESSPEAAKTDNTPTVTEPNTTPKIEQKTVKRRSLKSLQEQEERLHQRKERERQREEAKDAKEKKKEEARKLKEEREKERKEKKEKEEREKRDKREKEEKEKAEKLRAKEEQRKSKQEAKLEEKRKKEEEKRLKEEKDRLKAEKAEITRFLQKPKTPQQATKTLASACEKFAPFEIKEHMCLAPLTRVQCAEAVLEELDRYLAKPDGSLDGLSDWTKNKPRRSGQTKPRSTYPMRECMAMVVEGPKPDGVPDRQHYGRMKLLQFRENYRPAYWGTWRKNSPHISPRCPLRQDKDLLDYEVDSDEEWEEEEPGESLSHSEGEDNDNDGGENDDDDEDGFFVPHGYLSDGEGALEEEEGGDPEKQKVRQKLKAREWDELMAKKKVKVLEAVVRGCVWEGQGPHLELLQQFAVCLLEPLPKPESSTPEDNTQKLQEDEQLLFQLLPLLHGNVNSNKVIITEFQEFCRQQLTSPISSPQNSGDNIPTRVRLKRLIKGNAVYEKRSAFRRCCWYVKSDVLARFIQEALPVPCQWNYLTSGTHVPREEAPAATGSQGNSPTTPQASHTPSSKTPSSNKRKSAGSMSITKFMKKAADPEQVEAMKTDGFQADTEEDEDEADCVIISTQKGSSRKDTSPKENESTEQMEVTPSDTAALFLPRATPTLA